MFKIAAIIIAIAILIASICCGAACLILVIKRYKVRNMYLVDLSNIKQNDVEIEENKEDNRNKFESNNLNANYNIKQTSFY
jgi:hypothetical protein